MFAEEGLEQQVLQGTEAVKSAALFFHKQDLQSRAEECQLIPYAESSFQPASCNGHSPSRLVWNVCLPYWFF
jgi:hypothetical protein